MTKAHVQMISTVNADAIKKETIDGEPHYRIPSATLPDDVVMNGGLYPADEIAKSYGSLEGTPAPLGHPMIDGHYVSALSPRAMNRYSVGAWNENVRREGGRVRLDKVVNIRIAQQSEQGRQLLEAIEKKQPIHTSTGIHLERETAANADAKDRGYSWIARNMQFDHDAILLGEVGAATPEQGVGMFVNLAQEQVDVLVGNLDMTADETDRVEYAIESIVEAFDRAQRREQNKGVIAKLRDAIKSALGGAQDTSSESLATNATAPEGDMKPEEIAAALEPALAKALEPITNQLTEQGKTIAELKTNADAAAKALKDAETAERAPLVEKAKAAGLEDADIEGMSTNALKRIYGQPAQPSQGYHLNTAFAPNGDQKTYELPE